VERKEARPIAGLFSFAPFFRYNAAMASKHTVSITANNHPIGSGITEKKNCACGGKGCCTPKEKADGKKGSDLFAKLFSLLKR
jgi:hypothetical protein